MTFWTYLLIIIGVVVVTAQLFRLIDLIERPASRRTRRRVQRTV